ncbi:hypothetical protein [Nannocystis sp. SCPEA4]|uniref:hypothetical protein n=1 Tax=Nannocystis sp. SCPEA4 TaxID=2996787 RepID=UPI002271E669|nr:hypothetical protein [Nannocystis sp. SCPEA4]MCY1056328.1 hypothetical protein [Nannocystis sp. SCPEA4]
MSHAALPTVVELLRSPDIDDVARALARLDALDDPELDRELADSFQPRAWRDESWQTGRGPLPEPIAWADQIGLAICARAGRSAGPRRILVDGYWDLSALPRFTTLIDLDLEHCARPADLAPVRHLAGLEKLSLHHNSSLEDLGPLRHLAGLHVLVLWFCPRIVDLSPLEDLRALYALHIDGCPSLADLSPLRHLTALAELSLERCPALTDLSPLLELHDLEYLDLLGSPEQLPGLDLLLQRPGLDFKGR